MRVTSKGQVTIPQAIREKLGITPNSEVDFVEEGDAVVLRKRDRPALTGELRRLVGTATVKMTTDEILRLTRGGDEWRPRGYLCAARHY